MDLIIIKQENGKLTVDESSHYKFPLNEDISRAVFEVIVAGITRVIPKEGEKLKK